MECGWCDYTYRILNWSSSFRWENTSLGLASPSLEARSLAVTLIVLGCLRLLRFSGQSCFSPRQSHCTSGKACQCAFPEELPPMQLLRVHVGSLSTPAADSFPEGPATP